MASVCRGKERAVLLRSEADPGWMFEYSGGQLQRFRLGGESPVLRIDYSQGRPRTLREDGRSDLLLQLDYLRGTGPVERMRIGGEELRFSYARSDAIAPDGVSYAGHRVELLSGIANAGRQPLYVFSYAKTGTRSGEVEYLDGEERKNRPHVWQHNRIEISDVSAGAKEWYVWVADNGFGLEDATGKYQVQNHSVDPLAPPRDRGRRYRLDNAQIELTRGGWEGQLAEVVLDLNFKYTDLAQMPAD